MQGVPSWVFVLVGVIVSLVSWRMPKFMFFFYVGLIFIVVGVFRLAQSYVGGGIKKDIERLDKSLAKHPQVTFCPRCNIPVYVTSNFCHHCGTRLK
ncbi:zinc ribbon domain-containing protein [Candidatus Woesearchaeota archaeon]|nr:zinc ribbon domain-containing protein [Candidatus Woesearchaeota archaeon]